MRAFPLSFFFFGLPADETGYFITSWTFVKGVHYF